MVVVWNLQPDIIIIVVAISVLSLVNGGLADPIIHTSPNSAYGCVSFMASYQSRLEYFPTEIRKMLQIKDLLFEQLFYMHTTNHG